MAEQQKPQSWWRTIPGVLTAIAGIITAITGLIVALNQTGMFSHIPVSDAPHRIEASSASSGSAASNHSSPTSNSNHQYPRAWDVGTEVRLSDAKYKILKAQLDRYNVENLSFTLSVRMTNIGRYPANFWDASFRLLIDEVPKAPISQLNKLVNGESAEEGDVLFVIPANTKSVVLRIHQGDESTDIPMSLVP